MAKKGEASAGERRRPRAPTISEARLKQHKDAVGDRKLWQLANRLEELEKLRGDGVLNTPFIALEALGALSGGLISGRSQDQLQTAWHEDWGDETMTVPLALILAIREVWNDYKHSPSGRTLGEAFQIEGGSQGKQPMKSKLATIDRGRRLAREVERVYLALEHDELALRLEEAIQTVAVKNGVSFSTVENSHKAHRNHIRSALREYPKLCV